VISYLRRNLYKSNLRVTSLLNVLSRVTVTKDWVRIGKWIINHLQAVTTINYYTVTGFHTAKHSTLNSSGCLHLSSRIYNTGTSTVSLNYTLQILRINEVFKSHVKSSQADF
jgi:hypothetical protein